MRPVYLRDIQPLRLATWSALLKTMIVPALLVEWTSRSICRSASLIPSTPFPLIAVWSSRRKREYLLLISSENKRR